MSTWHTRNDYTYRCTAQAFMSVTLPLQTPLFNVNLLVSLSFSLFQIAEKQKKIAEEKSKRKGSIPMSVYHNIEQCLREVEVSHLGSIYMQAGLE